MTAFERPFAYFDNSRRDNHRFYITVPQCPFSDFGNGILHAVMCYLFGYDDMTGISGSIKIVFLRDSRCTGRVIEVIKDTIDFHVVGESQEIGTQTENKYQ